MKNTEIKNLHEVVPVNIRLQVYKETRDYLANPSEWSNKKANGLCLLLPVILWDLNTFYGKESYAPDGSPWLHEDTIIAFPELTEAVIENIVSSYTDEITDAKRIKYLDTWIKELKDNEHKEEIQETN